RARGEGKPQRHPVRAPVSSGVLDAEDRVLLPQPPHLGVPFGLHSGRVLHAGRLPDPGPARACPADHPACCAAAGRRRPRGYDGRGAARAAATAYRATPAATPAVSDSVSAAIGVLASTSPRSAASLGRPPPASPPTTTRGAAPPAD